MGMRAVIAPRNCLNLQHIVPQNYLHYNASSKPASAISFPSKPSERDGVLVYGFLGCPSAFSWSGHFKVPSDKQACNANSSGGFYDDELSNQTEELLQNFDNEDDNASTSSKISMNSTYKESKNWERRSFPSMEVDILQPSMLGIQRDPPDWPERREIVRFLSIEIKANSVELPLSIRMIKRKRKQFEESLREAGEFTCCSVNKAFSSMVFIVRELQSYALSIRGSLNGEDLEEIIGKVQREINASFLWLFQQVFSRTPSLMIYVVVLVANFSVYSMADNAVVAATPLPALTESFLDEVSENETLFTVDHSNGSKSGGGGDKVNPTASGTEGGDRILGRSSIPIQYPKNIVQGEMYGDWFAMELIISSEEEMSLWESMVEEASRMKAELKDEALDQETMHRLVAPVYVEIEADDRDLYFRTDLSYQIGLLQDPDNPLLLFNYAQFLYLVVHDHDRAEDCFRRAVQVDQPDALALSQYAEFLWMVRKDYWGAEERYLEAMAAEPKNRYHASKYANFLWNTGGRDTCFPLDNDDNYDKDYNA
ncbi:uncharacterized protein LOC107413776 [Ziziphus jujuba]|uniref:Uncharacterized protein LOC107413776 n=1 Tax=Ziziphus jujuba TaxID=326968 RepID=A0A6P3ZE51_ZIZJJ|nr:uncharacterized protein LOC107413776 [Ziziphus jujuba]